LYQSNAITANKDQATIVVYRPSRYEWTGRYYPININGIEVCNLGDASFFTKQMNAGDVNISSSVWDAAGTSRLAIKAKPGRIYYVKILPANYTIISQWNHGPFEFNLIDESQAKQDLSGLHVDCQ
jgi:hypothetical protein